MRIIAIPDSFKGSISSLDACDIIEKSIKDTNSNIDVIKLPIADGGEGTVDCFLNITSGEKIYINTLDLYNNPITVYVCKHEDTYILEMASSAGITLHETKNPYIASTYGVGLIIDEIIKYNPKKIIISLGGSGTNDCGVGMAIALGTIFYDSNGFKFTPTVNTLDQVMKIDNSITKNKLKDIEIIAMCDVTNPLCGPLGATNTFGPQKGINKDDLPIIDDKVAHLGQVIQKELKIDVLNVPGSGAAGGMGAAVLSFLNGKLQSGINTILDLINFDKLLNNTDYVITGEGCFDSQSLNGKVISGITKRCKDNNVLVIIVCGLINDIDSSVYSLGIEEIHSINPKNETYIDSIKNVKINLYNKIKEIIKTKVVD